MLLPVPPAARPPHLVCVSLGMDPRALYLDLSLPGRQGTPWEVDGIIAWVSVAITEKMSCQDWGVPGPSEKVCEGMR